MVNHTIVTDPHYPTASFWLTSLYMHQVPINGLEWVKMDYLQIYRCDLTNQLWFYVANSKSRTTQATHAR